MRSTGSAGANETRRSVRIPKRGLTGEVSTRESPSARTSTGTASKTSGGGQFQAL